MQATVIVTAVYALLLLAGGLMGAKKAQSQASLWSGAVSAALAAVACILMLLQKPAGLYLALVVALVLGGWGLKSWQVDKKPFMPRGLVFVLSLVELLAVVGTLLMSAVAKVGG